MKRVHIWAFGRSVNVIRRVYCNNSNLTEAKSSTRTFEIDITEIHIRFNRFRNGWDNITENTDIICNTYERNYACKHE